MDKQKLSRRIEKLHETINSAVVGLDHKEASDLVFASCTWNNIRSLRKKFDAAKKAGLFTKDCEDLMAEIESLAAQISEISEEDKKRKAGKREKAASTPKTASGLVIRDNFAVFSQLMTKLATNRLGYINHCVEAAVSSLEKFIEKVEADGSKVPADWFHQYGIFQTKWNGPEWAKEQLKSPTVKETVKRRAKESAEADFDSFIYKLAAKIVSCGADVVVNAKLEGVWTGLLRVETDRGHQLWHTKYIINQTNRGRPYGQWPTVLVEVRNNG